MADQAQEVFEAFRASMLDKSDAWMDLLAEDVSLTGPLAQVQGKKAFIEVNQPFFASIQGSELLEQVATGKYIITQITTDVAVPSGKTLTLQVCEWYQIAGGKITALRVYFDTAEFLKEMNAG